VVSWSQLIPNQIPRAEFAYPSLASWRLLFVALPCCKYLHHRKQQKLKVQVWGVFLSFFLKKKKTSLPENH
jgi:hypothetical protein